ncbi:PREDICTED: uncharacterized protein LOC106816425, partial [Priapulus caudatus]|uniref:Uncharacterized protein LOC106816425 n=1 Tax=Priapulus caudatus TaxID=37621 RepID=A0ABM1EWG0_PRICU
MAMYREGIPKETEDADGVPISNNTDGLPDSEMMRYSEDSGYQTEPSLSLSSLKSDSSSSSDVTSTMSENTITGSSNSVTYSHDQFEDMNWNMNTRFDDTSPLLPTEHNRATDNSSSVHSDNTLEEDIKWDCATEYDTEEIGNTKGTGRLRTIQLAKLFIIIVTFALVFSCAILSKGCILLLTAQIGKSFKSFPVCESKRIIGKGLELPDTYAARWIWCLYFTVCFPYTIDFIECMRKIIFRTRIAWPSLNAFLI